MKEIEIFKIEGLMRDGGSINSIYTNIGIFSRVKRLGKNKIDNGFYLEGKRVDEELATQLESALYSFFAAKKEKYEENKLKEAIETLTKALKEDEGYRRSWSASISMAFKDEHYRQSEERDFIDLGKLDIHEIANNAAENFLDLLCLAEREE